MAGVIQAWGVFAAGILQLWLLMDGLRRNNIWLKLRRPRMTEGVRRLIALGIPGVIAGGVTQLNIVIGTVIASLQNGAVSYLYYADRLYELPLAIVGIAIGVVLLPELSQKLASGNATAAMHSHNRALEFALLLTLPAAAALCAVPGPIIEVLFQRGAFHASDTQAVSMSLAAFAAGLPASVLIRVFLPGFFAREDTRTPMIYAGISAAVNIAGSLSMFFVLGHVGIAIATTLAAWTNAIMLCITLVRRGHFELDASIRRRGTLITLASLVMALGLWGLALPLGRFFAPVNGIVVQGTALSALIAAGGLIYLATAQITGAFSARSLLAAVKRG
jgi:putative peptidoglycan lipid II flippase